MRPSGWWPRDVELDLEGFEHGVARIVREVEHDATLHRLERLDGLTWSERPLHERHLGGRRESAPVAGPDQEVVWREVIRSALEIPYPQVSDDQGAHRSCRRRSLRRATLIGAARQQRHLPTLEFRAPTDSRQRGVTAHLADTRDGSRAPGLQWPAADRDGQEQQDADREE